MRLRMRLMDPTTDNWVRLIAAFCPPNCMLEPRELLPMVDSISIILVLVDRIVIVGGQSDWGVPVGVQVIK